MLQPYETLFFTRPEISEDELKTVMTKLENALTKNGGQLEQVDHWGKRKLAYEVEKYGEGHYTLVHFKGSADDLKELERFFLINQDVLRFITTRRVQ